MANVLCTLPEVLADPNDFASMICDLQYVIRLLG